MEAHVAPEPGFLTLAPLTFVWYGFITVSKG